MARVLHIEQDAATRKFVHDLLVGHGHSVESTASGLEGVQLARMSDPDLILVDVSYNDLDGYEVTLRLLGLPTLRGVPIVMTGQASEEQTSLAVGASGFIAKPFDSEHFRHRMDDYLRGQREYADETGEYRLRERSQKIVERLEKKVRELQHVNVRLEEMARLRREFLRNVTHELATPMTPVVGYIRLLLNGELGPLTPLQKKCIQSIESSTERLRSLIDMLLDISSLETERMHFYEREFDLGELMDKVVEDARARMEEKAIVLHYTRPKEPLPCKGDSDKLRRACTHILDNAAKFTPPEGDVAVEIRKVGTDRYALDVADSGSGLDETELNRVVEPFYQADGSVTRDHGGVGLGLAFAKKVSQSFGGDIKISSPPNAKVSNLALKGTLVTVWVRAYGKK